MSWRRHKKPRKKKKVSKSPLDVSALRVEYEIIGIDESGWGPIAGPLYVAGVVIPANTKIPDYIKDSKALSEKKRKVAYEWITRNCPHYIACVPASFFAYKTPAKVRTILFKQVHSVLYKPGRYSIIDGNVCPLPLTEGSPLIKADRHIPEVSAASILAKVSRDHDMVTLGKRFPEFNFAQHKGYPTPEHIYELAQYGATPIHRQNIKRVKESKTYETVE